MPYDLQSVLAHETGHALGLGEDYVDGAATMFVSTMPGDVSKRQLSADDRGAISQVYGEDGAAAPSKGCSLEARPVGNGSPLAFLLLGALAVVRRRRNGRG
jgi:MYXO-CTERM domain-containing protein